MGIFSLLYKGKIQNSIKPNTEMKHYTDLYTFLKIGKENNFKHFNLDGLVELKNDFARYDRRFNQRQISAKTKEAYCSYFQDAMKNLIYRESGFFANMGNSKFLESPELLLKNTTGGRTEDYKVCSDEEIYFDETMRNLDLTTVPGEVSHAQGSSSSKPRISTNAENIVKNAKNDRSTQKDYIKKSMDDLDKKWEKMLTKNLGSMSKDLNKLVREEVDLLQEAHVKQQVEIDRVKENAQQAMITSTENRNQLQNLDDDFENRVERKVVEMVRDRRLAVGGAEPVAAGAPLAIEGNLGPRTEWEKRNAYTQYQLCRADYRSAIYKAIEEGKMTIKVVNNDNYIEENGEEFEVRQNRVERQIKNVKLRNVTCKRTKREDGNFRYTITATIDATFRFRGNIFKRILTERNQHKGELGISITVPQNYNIDSLLNYWKRNILREEVNAILGYDYTRLGFLVVYLNDATEEKRDDFRNATGRDPRDREICTRILPGCPRQLSTLVMPTYDDLKKLADFKKFFVYEGEVWDVPNDRANVEAEESEEEA